MEIRGDFFRRMVEASRDGLWVIDGDGTIVFANHRLAELLGRSEDELVGAPAATYFDEQGKEDLARHLAALEVAPDDDPGEDNVELRLIRADGRVTWALASHSPVRDDDGRRIAWLHRLSDNTEQKRLTDSLRTREGLLADAQEIARIGSWEWDVASDTVTWSDQLYKIYNVTPQEFEATYAAFLDFIHPDDRSMVEQAVGSVFAGADDFAWDARVLPRGGDIRWVRGLGRVRRGADGQPASMGGTAQDITERVVADLQAAEATRRLHLLQVMASAANQTNSLGEAVELAAVGLPAFTSWLPIGDHRYDADGTLLETRDLRPGDRKVPEFLAVDLELAELARSTQQVQHRPVPGRETTHSSVALPVLLDGTVVCVVEVLADEVPPDEDSRALMDQISVQLGQVAQREASARHLAEARDEAMEASRLKSEFLATMSHEIRTPMNGVIGLNDLLLRTSLDAQQRRLAEGVQGAGLTLLGIINDILDLSKVEAGKLELEEVDFDVRAVFDKTVDVLGGPAHDKGIELVAACHPDVPAYLRGDPGRLGQVLSNLGSNAVKFTESGEVALRARVEEETEDGRGVVLRVDVTDTGVGIEPSLHESLFDAFTQADPSTTREHGGTGLGLAICRELVGALGGRIWVESSPGDGSTFSFTVTLGKVDEPPERRDVDLDPAMLRHKRVLVVDDNATNRLILDEQLNAWRMTPVLAASVEEATTRLREAATTGEPFDLVLLDMLLPDGDGLALARAITAGSTGVRPHLLLLSSGHSVDTAAARAAGIGQILTKPVRQSELLDALVSEVAAAASARQVGAPELAAQPEGGRILVVEDNPINQMVAVGLLEAAGFAADVVGDGLEAVDALHGDHPYAAVLMDCRMPRLDGFDATRAIRSAEPPGRHVPIIAMTASALEGEAERCVAAGMDDFLTKPVDAVRMLRVLRAWIDTDAPPAPPAPAEAAAAEEAAPPPATSTAPVIDRERMEMLDEMVKDGISLFDKAATNFAANAAGYLDEVRAALVAADAEDLTATAHKLKGSATNLGLPALGEAAEVLEIAGRDGDLTDTGTAMAALEAEMARSLAALQEVRDAGL